MSEQAQEKAQEDSSQKDAVIAAVVAILVAGPPLIVAIQAISAATKTPKKLALGLLTAMKYKPGKKAHPKGEDPVMAAHRANLRYRALYILAALQRLATADNLQAALTREKALFAQHQQACARRVAAAKASKKMAAVTHSQLLGWGGILDDKTTPDCRWLIGKNFRADNPPGGLHPGGRHPRCRCYPTPAYVGKRVVDALPAHLSVN
jgi:hypothetical protein